MNTVTIYLGSKCNLNCKYCHRESNDREQRVSDKLIQKLRTEQPERIRFMGGEPTLYMEDVKKVVEACPKAQFGITTNGVLLDKFIDYFCLHNFHIIISYDGNETSQRGYDPFKKLIKYNNIGVSCTLYHGNTNLKQIIRNFAKKEKIVGRPLYFYPHIMHVTNDENNELALTKADVDEIVAGIKEIIESFVSQYLSYGLTNLRYFPLFKQLWGAYKANYSFGETYCCNRNVKKVDSEGAEWSCLYIRDVAGNTDDIAKTIPQCESCGVYSMCGGACIKSKAHGIECYYYKQIYTWFKNLVERPENKRLELLMEVTK